MAMPRWAGGRSLTSMPSIHNSPSVISSSPAIRRSKVDLPQPDGPTKTTNSLSRMSRSIPLMMVSSPKLLIMPRNLTSAMSSPVSLSLSLDGAGSQARHDVFLRCEEDDDDRQDRERDEGKHKLPVCSVFAPVDHHAERPGIFGLRIEQDERQNIVVPTANETYDTNGG